jgi:hypothetical protein
MYFGKKNNKLFKNKSMNNTVIFMIRYTVYLIDLGDSFPLFKLRNFFLVVFL